MEPPVCAFTPTTNDHLGTSEDTIGDANDVPLYKATPLRKSQIKCHRKVIIRDDEATNRDWCDDIKTGD